jgi:hypothetical protein
MAYIITKTNGTQIAVVDDGSIEVDSTNLSLIGQNYAGYGLAINENFVRLLENFANTTEPTLPLTGQSWYDTASKKLKVYNGREFKSFPALQSSSSQPSDLFEGDLWYDDSEGKLYYYDGSAYSLIGPQFSGQQANTLVTPAILQDNVEAYHYVLKHQIQNYTDETVITTVAITSSDEFEMTAGLVPGFTKIKEGITLRDANPSTGVSATSDTNDSIFWGTSADSLRLASRVASDYVTYDTPSFNVPVTISSAGGININSNAIRLFVDSGVPRISSNTANIRFNLTSGANSYNVFNISADSDLAILPSRTVGALTNIGSTTYPWNNIYSTGTVYCTGISSTGPLVGNLTGTATQADTLKVNGIYAAATTINTANTIVARDASGNFSAGTLTATATSAKYADLAEKYLADTDYEPGTVLKIGGRAEVTICTDYAAEEVIGVVSSDPAYLMNSGLVNGVAVALRGRVPCKVTGTIKKGNALVSSALPGHATARNTNEPVNPLTIIGKALQDFEGDYGIIEILV